MYMYIQIYTYICMRMCMCVRVCVRERERERERKTKRVKVCVHVCVRACVCVCVCEREREREKKNTTRREGRTERVCPCAPAVRVSTWNSRWSLSLLLWSWVCSLVRRSKSRCAVLWNSAAWMALLIRFCVTCINMYQLNTYHIIGHTAWHRKI